ncbi:hypothetical protein [Methylotenera sp. L2L1]|uniref:hypothetical protein n=1 Tax=Methylotenera sp. L2L1 TaxID=1502770 RepID=UPI00055D0659|nr:hypothetical protein [Methylotenera sp. L2L1]
MWGILFFIISGVFFITVMYLKYKAEELEFQKPVFNDHREQNSHTLKIDNRRAVANLFNFIGSTFALIALVMIAMFFVEM